MVRRFPKTPRMKIIICPLKNSANVYTIMHIIIHMNIIMCARGSDLDK